MANLNIPKLTILFRQPIQVIKGGSSADDGLKAGIKNAGVITIF